MYVCISELNVDNWNDNCEAKRLGVSKKTGSYDWELAFHIYIYIVHWYVYVELTASVSQ